MLTIIFITFNIYILQLLLHQDQVVLTIFSLFYLMNSKSFDSCWSGDALSSMGSGLGILYFHTLVILKPDLMCPYCLTQRLLNFWYTFYSRVCCLFYYRKSRMWIKNLVVHKQTFRTRKFQKLTRVIDNAYT